MVFNIISRRYDDGKSHGWSDRISIRRRDVRTVSQRHLEVEAYVIKIRALRH